MKSKIATKHALISSMLALFLCVAMLIGSTFAWFTDTASTGVNKIEAGTLVVDILDASDKSIKGKSMSFVNKENSTDILWEPGATFRTTGFKVKNGGTLALKYKLAINGVTGTSTTDSTKSLLDVITFSVVKSDGSEVDLNQFEGHLAADKSADELLYIQGTMEQGASNDYQGLTLEGIGITVKATQDTVEYDSTENTYDAGAQYDEKTVFTVGTVSALKSAAENAKAGDEIILTSDITLSENIRFAASGITFNGGGHTITAEMTDAQVENLATLLSFGYGTTYCTGVTVKDVTFAGKGGWAMHFHGGTSSLLENVKIEGEWSLAINFYGTHGAVMNNCDISSTYANKYAKGSIFANEQSANQIILNNTKIDSIFVNATENGATYANNGIKIVVNAGSEVTEIHTNNGITRTFHEVNGGTVGSVLADVE